MLKNNINKISELQDLLDSDDELPTNYKEEPTLPAYLYDERFDPIQFNWIKSNKIRSIPVKPAASPAPVTTASTQEQADLSTAKQTHSEGNLIKKGILNEQDILCMKIVAAQTTDDSALLWFINFLMYKDLQADYTFLKSCLVTTQNYESTRKPYSQIFFSQSLSSCFELTVK